MRKHFLFVFFAVLTANSLWAYKFEVKADRDTYIYKCGEKATFTVMVKEDDGSVPKSGEVTFRLDDFMVGNKGRTVSAKLEKKHVFKCSGTLETPGFLRLSVMEGGKVKEFWSVAYEPEKIRKGSPLPSDFDDFWQNARRRFAAEVKEEVKMWEVPEKSTDKYTMYKFVIPSIGRQVWGMITIPKGKAPNGKWPVQVQIASAGWGFWTNYTVGSSSQAKLWFSVYPFEPSWQWETDGTTVKFQAMQNECIKKWHGDYAVAGLSGKREDYFFLPVILAADRMVNWFAARPDIDERNVVYNGGSQGGGLGIMLVSVNHIFRKAYFQVPAITDIMGYKVGRESGWPRPYEGIGGRLTPEERDNLEANLPYYDAANCISRITCPIRVLMGLKDNICVPPAIYAGYNEIKVKDKGISMEFNAAHGQPDTAVIKMYRWLEEK